MKEKVKIIQFMPYFPPHKGGLETVGEEIAKNWVQNELGECVNIVFDVGQVEKNNYVRDGYRVILVPSFDIISNFPVPKFWKKEFWNSFNELKGYLNENTRVITHTRFFLSSFIGGIFARKNKLKWIHIEHGSDYVKLSSKIKSVISFIYDKIIGKWIFKKANKVLAISGACKSFINKEFINREVEVFYRGVDVCENNFKKSGNIKFIFVGRLVKLKGVIDLINAYKISGLSNELIIIGDGEEKNHLEKYSKGFKINFLGFKNKDFVINYLFNNNCILINPSYQEGMPTTVIEGLITSSLVIASNVGGTSEISNKEDLILFEAGNIEELKEKLIKGIKDYDNLKGLSLELINNRFNREKNIFNLYDLVK